jgi:hypothetical protein
MTTKANQKPRPTTMVPVTTMEEIPVLSDEERAALLTKLKDAEARIEAGQVSDFDPEAFEERLVGIYQNRQR